MRHAIDVYRNAIAGDWHHQCRDFHSQVADDAAWSLAQLTGEPFDGTATPHREQDPKTSLREVYSEIRILLDRGGLRERISGLQARRAGAAFLGIPYAEYVRVMGAKR